MRACVCLHTERKRACLFSNTSISPFIQARILKSLQVCVCVFISSLFPHSNISPFIQAHILKIFMFVRACARARVCVRVCVCGSYKYVCVYVCV